MPLPDDEQRVIDDLERSLAGDTVRRKFGHKHLNAVLAFVMRWGRRILGFHWPQFDVWGTQSTWGLAWRLVANMITRIVLTVIMIVLVLAVFDRVIA